MAAGAFRSCRATRHRTKRPVDAGEKVAVIFVTNYREPGQSISQFENPVATTAGFVMKKVQQLSDRLDESGLFSTGAALFGVVVPNGTHRRCNLHRHDGCL
jgi:exonuclease VII large subunit